MSLLNQGFPQPLVAPVALAVAQASARPVTGTLGAAAPDIYAANSFSPDYVADFSAASADYFRVAGNDSDFETAFTSDSEGGGLATQVDSSGNLVWRAHNLLSYSEQFDNAAWSKGTSASAPAANAAVAPDGTTTADKIFADTDVDSDQSVYFQSISAESVTRTFAVCLKAEAYDYAIVVLQSTATQGYGASFDLSSGSIVSTRSTNTASSITSLGDGWYLCAVTVTGVANVAFAAVQPSSDGVVDSPTGLYRSEYTGDGTSGVYAWGAHCYRSDLGGMADNPDAAAGLEQYVPTTTAARYLTRRRHHRWDGSAWVPTCLHEPVGATNEVLNCRDLSASSWTRRGTAAVVSTEGAGGDSGGGSRITVSTGVNDVIESTAGAGRFPNNQPLAVSLRVKPVSGAGDLKIANAVTAANGGWTLDLSALPTDRYTWIYAGHPAVTVANAFSATSSGAASVRLFSTSGALTVDIDTVQVEQTAGLPSSSIITNGSTVTRTADTLKGKAASLPYSSTAISMAVKGRYALSAASGAFQPRFLSWYEDANNRMLLFRSSAGAAAAFMETAGATEVAVSTGAIPAGAAVAVLAANRFVASGEIQAALGGAAGTVESATTPAMPPLADDDLYVSAEPSSQATNGNVDTIRLWDEDIAEAGIESGSAGVEIQGLPTISGTEAVGSTLTASAATVVGGPSPSTTWQWQRSANGTSGWADISGATSSTYTLVSADENQYVRAVQTTSVTAGGDTYTDSANSAASGQVVAQLLGDLVAYWNLDETSGDRADSSVNGYTLTDNNTVGSAAGVGGGQTAADFVAANNEYLSTAGDIALRGGTVAWSVAGWFYLDSDVLPGTPSVISCSSGSGQAGFQVSITGGTGLRVGAGTGSSFLTQTHPATLVAGAWYFVYAQWTGAQLGISLSGGAISQRAMAAYDPGITNVWVGRNPAGGAYIDGRIAALGRWNRVLTSAEITWLYNSGTAARLYSDLESYNP